MSRISPKGVILGGLLDITTSFIAIFVIGIVALARAPGAELPDMTSGWVSLAGTVTGVLCSILGGYVAARIAAHDEVLNGALSAWACVGLGVLMARVAPDAPSLGQSVVLLGASPALGALGGYLRLRTAIPASEAVPG